MGTVTAFSASDSTTWYVENVVASVGP